MHFHLHPQLVSKSEPARDENGRFASKMYRGHGKGSSTTGALTWVTPDKDTAKGYADHREDGGVSELDVEMKNTFDAGHDTRKLTPSKFAIEVLTKAKAAGLVDDKTALALRSEFMKDQPKEEVAVHSLWADEEGKARVSKLLSGAGFDSVSLTEQGKPTYGLLKKQDGFLSVFKANPYHDERGRFSDANKAKFVSIGGVFDKQRAKASAKEKGPTTTPSGLDSQGAEARKALSAFVDFDVPLARIDAINAKVREKNAVTKEMYAGMEGHFDHLLIDEIPPAPKPGGDLVTDNGTISEKTIRDAFSAENTSIYMAMSRATALKILGGSDIKNSLQTGTGTFKTIGEDRAKKEKEFLGIKADTDSPENFPKYGFVSDKGSMNDTRIVGFGYGSLYLEFDDSIRDRTTATIGDSYNNNSGSRYAIPAPINAMSAQQFAGGPIGEVVKKHTPKIEAGKTPKVGDLSVGAEYVEAQIFGKLDASHIKAIHVESAKDAKALTAAMKKAGNTTTKIVPSNHHTILSQLKGGMLAQWEKVSPTDLSKLGDAYVDAGWNSGMTGANLWSKGWASDLKGFNLPKMKEAIAAYPKWQSVPTKLKRELMLEYLEEGRKGAAGTLPKTLQRKKSTMDGFTDDVLNTKLLEDYT